MYLNSKVFIVMRNNIKKAQEYNLLIPKRLRKKIKLHAYQLNDVYFYYEKNGIMVMVLF